MNEEASFSKNQELTIKDVFDQVKNQVPYYIGCTGYDIKTVDSNIT